MKYRTLILLLLPGCELVEKYPEGLATYSCTHQVTGTGEGGEQEILLEGSSEIDCAFYQEASDLMADTCSLDESNYVDDYEDVQCTWGCSVITECSE